ASHFLLDMIPHWDYTLVSKRTPESHGVVHKTMVFDRSFLGDCVKLGVDFGLGILAVLAFVVLTPSFASVLVAGLVGGVLPDVLQFGYFLAPRPLGWLQSFHEWIHSEYEIPQPLVGAFSQFLIAVLAVMVWAGVMTFIDIL
ncbi:MAG: hypothetical protein WEC58_01605, partial [Candidatus Paceibacterota bacterium]